MLERMTGKEWDMDAVLRTLALAVLVGVAAALLAVSMALYGPWSHP